MKSSPVLYRDRAAPVQVLLVIAPYYFNVKVSNLFGHWPNVAVADRAVVQLADGRDVGSGPGKEDLVGEIKLAAPYAALNDLHAKLVLSQLEGRVPGDAGQVVVGDQWSVKHPVGYQEQVFSRTLRD